MLPWSGTEGNTPGGSREHRRPIATNGRCLRKSCSLAGTLLSLWHCAQNKVPILPGPIPFQSFTSLFCSHYWAPAVSGTTLSAGETQIKHTIPTLKGLTACNGDATHHLSSFGGLEMVPVISPNCHEPRAHPPFNGCSDVTDRVF